MTKHNKIFLLSIGGVGLVALSGCLGTTTTPVAVTPAAFAPITGAKVTAALPQIKSATRTYNSLGSRSATTSILVGIGIERNIKNNLVYTTNDVATLTGNTREVSLITASSSNGYLAAFAGKADNTGKVTSANGNTLTPDKSINQAGYNYVGVVDTSLTDGTGAALTGVHVLGVSTSNADVPKKGRATYTGVAVVKGTTGTGKTAKFWALKNATAKVTANFRTSKVNTTITGTAATGVPLDEITLTGDTIFSNVFVGSTVSILKNKKTVTGYSGNLNDQSNGIFYGYNATKTGNLKVAGPAEVGGKITSSGSIGGVGVVYIAK